MNENTFSSAVLPSQLSLVAQAYGQGSYNSDNYNGTSSQQAGTSGGTTQTLLPPNTGFFFQQPAYIVWPSLLILAILVGTVSFLISKKIKSHRNK